MLYQLCVCVRVYTYTQIYRVLLIQVMTLSIGKQPVELLDILKISKNVDFM